MKQKFRETRNFIRQNRRGLNPQEKRWMVILKVGNRHLEKKLYPNPVMRYGRRAFNSLATLLTVGQGKKFWDGDINPSVKYMPQAGKQQATKQAPKQAIKAVPTITKLVPKNKYAALDDIKKSKGLSVR